MLQDLPTDAQRRELCELFSAAFIEIRSLGLSGRARQAAELAEVVHETPREMWGWGGWDPQFLRQRLAAY